MSFTYNDEGIRTSKTVNGVRTEYILNGSQILAEITDTHIIVYMYDAYGSPIGMQYKNLSASTSSWQVYWYSKNLQGDIVAVCDSSGAILITYKYDDAWGNYTTGYIGNSPGAAWRNPF